MDAGPPGTPLSCQRGTQARSGYAARAAFGFSRPAFYEAAAALERDGLPGLVPAKPGPRGAHKLTDEVVAFARARRAQDASLNSVALAAAIRERFAVVVHPRSVERATARAERARKSRRTDGDGGQRHGGGQ